MSKREKILLELLASIAIIGLSFLYLFMPALRRKAALEIEEEEVYVEAVNVKSIAEIQGLEEAVADEKKIASKNYDYFYGKLNSYTIDGILNDLVADSNLEILNMTISDYQEIDASTLIRGQDQNTEALDTDLDEKDSSEEDTGKEDSTESAEGIDFLLGCTVNLNVTGTYRQILELADKLNKESTCIEVTSLNVGIDQRNTESEEAVNASMVLLIYGVNKTVEEED